MAVGRELDIAGWRRIEARPGINAVRDVEAAPGSRRANRLCGSDGGGVTISRHDIADIAFHRIADDRILPALDPRPRDSGDRPMRRCVAVAIDLADEWLHIDGSG